MGHHADLKDLNNIGIALFIVAFLVTSYRCFTRYTKKLWGHDDSAALFSLFFFILYVIGSTYLANESAPQKSRIAGYYILLVGFFTPLWGARISIILTVVRITPWRLQKMILLWVVASFVLMWAVLVVQVFWECEITRPGWKQVPGSICIFPRSVPVALIITTVISDSILVATPLMIARGVRNRAVYYRLFFIFSMSIVTTIASMAHAILVVVTPGVMGAILGGVEAAVSIIVCSMSVIIPAVLRALGVGDPFMREDTVDMNLSTGADVVRINTTIELGLPIFRGAVVTDSGESEGPVASRQRDLVDLDVKDGKEHRLTAQASDGSLGNSKKILSLAGERDITDSLAQVRSTPAATTDWDIEVDIEKERVKRNST